MLMDSSQSLLLSLEDLTDFAAGFRASIKALEGARRKGNLLFMLSDPGKTYYLGPRICREYQKLLDKRKVDPSPFHDFWIEWLLDDFERRVRCPEVVIDAVDATPPKREGPESESQILEMAIAEPAGPSVERGVSHIKIIDGGLVLRRDQIAAAKDWGIAYRLETPELTERLTGYLVESAQDKFARDFNDLGRIEFTRSKWRFLQTYNKKAAELSFAFERLVIDIINENGYHAQEARLWEDLLEKTDVRSHVSGLRRKHGERVQVSLISNESDYIEKMSRMPYPDEIIMIAPYSLAQAAGRNQQSSDWADFDWDGFWATFPVLPGSAHELAQSLCHAFVEALSNPHIDPRGPLGALLIPVRRYVRTYLEKEALRCHSVLRQREAIEGTESYRYKS